MANLTFNPTRVDFQGIIYPGLSAQDVVITNAVGASAIITGITLNNSQFSLNAYSVVSAAIDVAGTKTITLSSNWTNAYLNSGVQGLLSFTVSGQGFSPALSTVTYAISGLFDGISINDFSVAGNAYTDQYFNTITYPQLSSGTIKITNNTGASATVIGISINNTTDFSLNTTGALVNIGGLGGTKTFILSSAAWPDPYLDAIRQGTITVTLTSTGIVGSPTGTATATVSALYNGLEYPSSAVDVDGFTYDSPQEHARLYVNGEI